MDKRYQVFVSSTYADLKDERGKVIQALMEMDCIPAGMELFPASDDDQWNFIKKVIDDCDYYILIIGGRYGSLNTDGIGYTEQEFDYATSRGLKILSFVHGNPNEIPLGKSEIDPALRARFEEFRLKVCSDRLVRFWHEAAELPGLVALSLSKTIKAYPAVGWVRASTAATNEVLSELNDARKSNADLQKEVAMLQALTAPKLNLAGLDELFKFRLKWHISSRSGSYDQEREYSLSWRDIFASIAPELMSNPADVSVSRSFGSALYSRANNGSAHSAHLNHDDFQTIKIQLVAQALVRVDYLQNVQGGYGLYWILTEHGRRLMTELRSVKSDRAS